MSWNHLPEAAGQVHDSRSWPRVPGFRSIQLHWPLLLNYNGALLHLRRRDTKLPRHERSIFISFVLHDRWPHTLDIYIRGLLVPLFLGQVPHHMNALGAIYGLPRVHNLIAQPAISISEK